ncbi:zinc finger protein [Vigna unguiculata]|uniref:Zinc finger protein n=1 Tax=Vigna unguiculata TaxID=3917 RepID=A0A4D6MFG6_VIGUN|nr:zinc finger protein [Vigna unguiculata]
MEGNARSQKIVDVGSVVEAVSAEDGDAPLYSLDSLCMRCGENGITRFLLTLIPQFKKVCLVFCSICSCDWQVVTVFDPSLIGTMKYSLLVKSRGCRYILAITSGEQKMLNRQVVKSESATIKIPELNFEIPPEAQCGSLSTLLLIHISIYFVEGILMRAADELQALQEERKLKPGGRIPEKGKKITLSVKNVNDLSRDVIKSDTASVKVPELDLELARGTLGGIVTTVEGLITRSGESLERVHGFTFGDSFDENSRSKWIDFKTRLNKFLSLEEAWTLILDDALVNSFIAPATDDMKEDKQLAFEEYERSWEQNEELGLNDMDTSSAEVGSKTE